MTAKIKLNATQGGGSASIQGPSNTSNDRVFTLPDSADATLLTTNSNVGKILQVVPTVTNAAASVTLTSLMQITTVISIT